MQASGHSDDRVTMLREQRRTLAAKIRSLLEQLDKLEVEFEATQQELLQMTGGRFGPPAA